MRIDAVQLEADLRRNAKPRIGYTQLSGLAYGAG